MTTTNPLSQRETEVALLLLQGKSNKQMAQVLGISEHTVEFHLGNIYRKLKVGSRTEAILVLEKLIGHPEAKPGESLVEETAISGDNQNRFTISGQAPFWRKNAGGLRWSVIAFLVVLAAVGGLMFLLQRPVAFSYERECENPGQATTGKAIWREHASGGLVHGQFGTTPEFPWPAKSGYVLYDGIKTPNTRPMYLKLYYSKNSFASTPILVYLDDETTPLAKIALKDQQNWDQFIWTEPILLGKFSSGLHALKFATDGQEYGVADLDKFILTTAP